MLEKMVFYLRFALALVLVAGAMAVSCPGPAPQPQPEPLPETKTVERRNFENAFVEGLYVKDSCLVFYDAGTFQRAMNPGRLTYRIQSDDQTQYLNIIYNDHLPSSEGGEVECEVHYSLRAGESTTLIVRFVVAKTSEDYTWLWNEFQKVGVIARRL